MVLEAEAFVGGFFTLADAELDLVLRRFVLGSWVEELGVGVLRFLGGIFGVVGGLVWVELGLCIGWGVRLLLMCCREIYGWLLLL